MVHFGVIHTQTLSSIGMAAMALLAILVRMRAGSRPLTPVKIIMPPLGMSTGFLMFALPAFRIPLLWASLAFAAGLLLLSYPLIRSTKLQLQDGAVYVKRSKAFVFVLLGLLVLRLALHTYIEEFISVPQTGALFFILAFGMLLPWRAAMLLRYRRLLGGGRA
jgi:membrane protein CcdC involved in cytochrome C biogenesis